MSMQMQAARARTMGDPGLLSTIGKIAGGVTGFVTGGPAGAVAGWKSGGALGSTIEGAFGGSKPPTMRVPGGGSLVPQGPGTTTTRTTGPLPWQTKTVTTTPTPQAVNGATIGCPSGYHPNKSGYFTKSEGWIPKGTKCVKNRRRNPANPRALDRAIGRLNSAKRLQSKLSGFSTRKYTASGKKKKC